MKFTKDPDATLDYMVDWSSWLALVGDAIASVEWLHSDGLAVALTGQYAPTNTATTATAWVSAGVLDEVETLTCRITTTNVPPRIEDRTLFLKITNR